jgi:hypothetical protein
MAPRPPQEAMVTTTAAQKPSRHRLMGRFVGGTDSVVSEGIVHYGRGTEPLRNREKGITSSAEYAWRFRR